MALSWLFSIYCFFIPIICAATTILQHKFMKRLTAPNLLLTQLCKMRKNKEVFFSSWASSELPAQLSMSSVAGPRAWGSHRMSLLLSVFGSLKGVLLLADCSRMTLCGVVMHHSLALGIVPEGTSHQNYRAQIKFGSPCIQPCPFLQLLVERFSRTAVISSGVQERVSLAVFGGSFFSA